MALLMEVPPWGGPEVPDYPAAQPAGASKAAARKAGAWGRRLQALLGRGVVPLHGQAAGAGKPRRKRKREAGAPEERQPAGGAQAQPPADGPKKARKAQGKAAPPRSGPLPSPAAGGMRVGAAARQAAEQPPGTQGAKKGKREKGRKGAREGSRTAQAAGASRSPQGAPAAEPPAAELPADTQPPKKRRRKGGTEQAATGSKEPPAADAPDREASGRQRRKGGGLLVGMQAKLLGAQFRWLNEQLYTTSGEEAFALMQREPQLFLQYHKGFQQQTKGWPQQPLAAAVSWLTGLPPGLTVADFGCGDAELAASIPQRTHSLDLVAHKPGITACNMARTPLGDASVDAAVFCLALMGRDYGAFLGEACRVLRPGGLLWIAEVSSRFSGASPGDLLKPFLEAVKGLGFQLKGKDARNPFFVTLLFCKRGPSRGPGGATAWPELKPCQYKRR